MKNLITIFDAKTEELVETIRIPASRKTELFDLMGWKNEEDEIYGYDLSAYQLAVIGKWLERDLNSPIWLVQLVSAAE
jgi:hypothetical protein